ATADAQAFVDRLIEASGLKTAGGGKLYKDVKAKTVLLSGSSDEPTATRIVDAFQPLQSAGDKDTVIVFLAGHGMSVKGGKYYYFLPSGAKGSEDNLVYSSVIGWGQLGEQLSMLKGHRMLFIDTCHAAAVAGGLSYIQAVVKEASDHGIVVF